MNSMKLRLSMATAMAGAIAGFIAPAHAQDSGTQASRADSEATEIVVTAQRRSERLTDVPASITTISDEVLSSAGINSSTDLAKVTPGLTMPFYGGFLQPALRGVTSGGANVGEASNVATYIDGVYQPQQIATLLEFPDIEQIEVLKGPQGALYGQNATGGAILVNSYAPSFTPTGKFSASYGNYDDVNLRGYASGPVADWLAVSLAGGYHTRDGFRRHVATGARDTGLESQMIRGKILVQPSDAVKVTFSGYYSDREDSAMYAGVALNGNSVGYALIPTAPRPTGPKQFGADPDVFTRVKSKGVNMRAEFDLGQGTLTNVTSYTKNKASYLSDADYSAVQYAEAYSPSMNGHYFITDTNFASDQIGIVSFLVGFFYLNGEENFDINGFRLLVPSLPPAPKIPIFQLDTFQSIEKRIYAVYGEVSIQPTDQLFITAGGRFTEEEQRGFSDFGGPTVLAYPGNPVTFSEFTPRVTARYAVNPDANVYLSWGKGFKSGGINLTDYALDPFRPERITAYEAGFKGLIADGLRVNVSAFYYDYKDLQIVQYSPPVYFEENAAEARIKGIDFDLSWAVMPDLTLTAGGAILDAKYRNAEATVFVPNGAGNTPVPDTDISGNRLIRAPKFTGNFAIDYSHETSAGRFGAYANVYYNSGFALEVSNRVKQDDFLTADLELSFAPSAMDGMRLVLWGKNLTASEHFASLLQSNFADGVSYADPRTYGVRAEYSF